MKPWIEGVITTRHSRPECVARSLTADHLAGMTTRAEGDQVVTTLEGDRLRSITASVDDYLMNLAIAEDICTYVSH